MDIQQSLFVQIDFFQKGVRNDRLTEADPTGKKHYDNKMFICFTRADGTQWVRPAYPRDFVRYKKQYAAFEAGQSSEPLGVPVSEIKGLTPAEQETLKELGITTLEGLVSSSLQVMKMQGERFVELRQYATGMLKTREGMEDVLLLRQKNAALEAEILRLKTGEEKEAVVKESIEEIESFKASARVRAVDLDDGETASDPFFSQPKRGRPRKDSLD